MPKGYQEVVEATAKRPQHSFSKKNSHQGLILLRDSGLISAPLMIGIGCLIPTILSSLSNTSPALFNEFNLSKIIGFSLIGYALSKPLLTVTGVLKNQHMEGVVLGRTWAVFSDEDGEIILQPPKIALLIIGARCNGPLGFLDKGFKDIGEQFTGMLKALADDETSGMLSVNLYFTSVEAVHKFSQGALHRQAAKDFNDLAGSTGNHYSIWHELFETERYEGYYINTEPRGLGAAFEKRVDKDGETVSYHTTLRRAHGKALTSTGRMNGGQ